MKHIGSVTITAPGATHSPTSRLAGEPGAIACTSSEQAAAAARMAQQLPAVTDANLEASLKHTFGRAPSVLVRHSLDWTDEHGRTHPGGRVLDAEAKVPVEATAEQVQQARRAVELALSPASALDEARRAIAAELYQLRIGCAKRPGSLDDEQGQAASYLDVLVNYPPDVALSAVRGLRGVVQFFPTERELRAELDSLMARRKALHAALLSWCPAKAEGEKLEKIRHAWRFWSSVVADGEGGREIRVSIGNGRNAEIVRTVERARELRDKAAALGGAEADPDRGDVPGARKLVDDLKAEEAAAARAHRDRLKALSDKPGSATQRAVAAAVARREALAAQRASDSGDAPADYDPAASQLAGPEFAEEDIPL